MVICDLAGFLHCTAPGGTGNIGIRVNGVPLECASTESCTHSEAPTIAFSLVVTYLCFDGRCSKTDSKAPAISQLQF